MIAEFTVENFRSFKEKKTFSLISTKDKELSESNTFETEKNLRFLRTAVIYGSNASGKSNFFNALIFFMQFSVFSGPRKQAKDTIDTEPFILSKQSETSPSSFEVIFIIKKDDGETRYRYGFSVDKKQVISEYLYAVINIREVMLFKRSLQEIEHSTYFKEGARGKLSVRNNCTFLSVCAQVNGDISTQIIEYFREIAILSGLYEPFFSDNEEIHPSYKKKILKFLKNADLQITNYKTEKIPLINSIPDDVFTTHFKNKLSDAQMKRILYGHAYFDGENPVGERYLDETVESAGTKKLFFYSRYIIESLENGTPMFIDEFDTMLHPLIIENIIKLFNSPMTNPKNAQLVISCHSVNIMTNKLLRRDQIWFCEKDKYGATDLYSLVEYKEPVRKDSSYNKNYLQGKYGAIPYIDNILLQSGFDK